MQTLSIFPDLLTFGLLSPLIIRIAIGSFLIYIGKKRYNKDLSWSSLFYIISGALLFVGLYTQVAVLLAIAVLKMDFYLDHYKNQMPIPEDKKFYYGIIIISTLSLIFTGPGLFAFDLPL